MRILLLGASGMLGHQLWRHLHAGHEVWSALRGSPRALLDRGLLEAGRTLDCTGIENDAVLESLLARSRPDWILNCIGVVKQRSEAADPVASIGINSLLPHRLAACAARHGARVLHLSTDCVFSGAKGLYREDDPPDATDLYGRSKLLGELTDRHCLTLRTSIIGRELGASHGLLEWFLAAQGTQVRGFTKAIFSGFTTLELARVIGRVITRHDDLHGLWHLSSRPVDKHALLLLFKEHFSWRGTIVPDDTLRCDRSLDSSRFRLHTGYVPPDWSSMVAELAASPA